MKLCIIDTLSNNLLTGVIVWMFSHASTVPMNVASCTHYNNMFNINYVFVFKIMRFIRFLMVYSIEDVRIQHRILLKYNQ